MELINVYLKAFCTFSEFSSVRRYNQYVVVILILIICDVTNASTTDQSKTQSSQSASGLKTTVDTIKLSELSSHHLSLLQDILSIMEELKMFSDKANKSSCYVLENIVKESNTSEGKLGIHFYFEENNISDRTKLSTSLGNSNSKQLSYGNEELLGTSHCNKSPLLPDIYRLDRLSRKQIDSNQKNTNTSGVYDVLPDPVGAQHTDDENLSENDKGKGLSRTQVIVIATCSAVIGTFFIIAGAMRIHYYLKRQRARRDATDSAIGRRASPFGFGGSATIRRDSACSKASRQQNYTAAKTGGDVQVDNGRAKHKDMHNSPEHLTDHNPLLPVVNRAGQFSERSNSSLGSLAFIDEDSHNRSKPKENESGSEDDPLLRKSPDSGSSLDSFGQHVNEEDNTDDIKSAVHDRNINDRCSKSPPVPTSPNREVVFEPGGESDTALDEMNYGANQRKDLETPRENCIETNKDNEATGIASDIDKSNIVDIEKASRPDSVTRDSVKSAGSKIPCKQFSVDYFDVDDNGVEIQNPIFEDPNELAQSEGILGNKAVTIGLTQSDSSLSNNPSYCYGNQTEYDACNGYGQVGYYYPENIDTGFDINNACLTIQNSLRNSMILSVENLRRENGNTFSDSCDEIYSGDSDGMNNSVDDSSKAKYSRMYSTESYFTTPVNRLSPFERSYSASPENVINTQNTQSTTGTMNFHIVPLQEYHNRNNLKDTIVEDDIV